jgi:hypothetical protein
MVSAFVLHQFPKHAALHPAALALLTILFIQLPLGILAFWARLEAAAHPLMMVLSTVAHVAVGAITLALSIVLAIQIRRNVRPHVVAAEPTHAAVTQ